MNIVFKKIHMHHFMSYDDATYDFTGKGICLVKGINNCSLDSAKSNGSGKSTLFNAISFALLGETLNGLKSKLGNIYFNDGCYVELEFSINNDEYRVVRSKEDTTLGTNLKLYINDVSKSGKGIRETEKILNDLLPDLTSELLGSVILLGQGLPQKFTANSPSGRKEVLEHLSHSDFMIEDLKQRVSSRIQKLYSEKMSLESSIMTTNTQLEAHVEELAEIEQSLIELATTNIDGLKRDLTQLKTDIQIIDEQYEVGLQDKESLTTKINYLTETLSKLNDEYTQQITDLNTKHNEFKTSLNREEVEYKSKVDLLKIKIEGKVCPYCNSRLDSDTHTHEDEVDFSKYQALLTEVLEDKKDVENKYQNKYTEFVRNFSEKKDSLNKDIKAYRDTLTSLEQSLSKSLERKNRYISESLTKQNLIEKYDDKYNELVKKKESKSAIIEKDKKNLKEYQDSQTNIQQHLEVVNKMEGYLKRDFRGILLSNVIEYINAIAKEYSKKIFNTDNLLFELDGNNINITFCDKAFENLSGGEQQRVNLIIQFALRNMLCKYFNLSCNILVLDEITDALDSISCDKVLKFITENINDVDSLFIISHHSDELNIGYDSTLVVTKDERGVSSI